MRRSASTQQRGPSSSTVLPTSSNNTKHRLAATTHHNNKDNAGDKTIRCEDNAASEIPHSIVKPNDGETKPSIGLLRHGDASLLAQELPLPRDDVPSGDKKETVSPLATKFETKSASLASVQSENRLASSNDSVSSKNGSVLSSKKTSSPLGSSPERKPTAPLRNATNYGKTRIASAKKDSSILPPFDEEENLPPLVDQQAPSGRGKSKRRSRRKDGPQARPVTDPPRTFYSHGMKVSRPRLFFLLCV